jgi:hypothetical protein
MNITHAATATHFIAPRIWSPPKQAARRLFPVWRARIPASRETGDPRIRARCPNRQSVVTAAIDVNGVKRLILDATGS